MNIPVKIIFQIALGLLFVSTTSFKAACPNKIDKSENCLTPDSIQTFEGGQIRILEGIPFLKLSGNYYEMGKQYGYLAKERIREYINYKKVNDFIENGKHPPKWLLKLVTPNRYLDIIDGISDGSGIPYNEVFWVSFMPDDFGCSSILTKFNNHLLLGHNQDLFLPARFKVVIEFKPKDSYKYIVTSMIGTIKFLKGMNEQGICVSNNAAKSTIQGTPFRWPSTRYSPCKNQQILEFASDIHDVDSLMESYDTDASILIVGSGKEVNGIIYDKPFENIKKNYFDDKDNLFVTNYYLHKDLDDHPEACPRYQDILNSLKNKPIISADDMIDLLANPGTLYGVNNHNTIHSIIFDPQNMQIYMSFHHGFAALGKWLKYDWLKDQFEVYREERKKYDTVFIKSFDTFNAISIRDTINKLDETGPMWSELYSYLRRIKINAPLPSMTICHDSLESGLDVETLIPLLQTAPESGRMHVKKMEGGIMACVVFKNRQSLISNAYDKIYKWAVENQYDIIGPAYECGLKGNWNEKDPNEWLTEVRIPVKKR